MKALPQNLAPAKAKSIQPGTENVMEPTAPVANAGEEAEAKAAEGKSSPPKAAGIKSSALTIFGESRLCLLTLKVFEAMFYLSEAAWRQQRPSVKPM